jgi:ubiquinone/menaquinone biosynthesis C-methylase UbiE
MDNEYKLIDEFDTNLIIDYFSGVERQGPGSPEVTLKALSFVDNLTDESRIADIGCGTGGQTRVLAQHAPGHITGVDLFTAFIEQFNSKAANLKLQDRVKGIVESMDKLSFQDEELDLIWSEGAIYNIGFERGINEWRRFLKPGGYIAVSEMTWFTEERPAEIQAYMQHVCPEIDLISAKVAQIEKAGYVPVATFTLPENCWTEHYFAPLITSRESFLKKYAGDKAAEEFAKSDQYEMELYHKYKAFHGYVFYIGKKIETGS